MYTILILIGSIIGSLIGIVISAWIFSSFFGSKEKMKEIKKQTNLLILMAKKQGVSDSEITAVVKFEKDARLESY